MCKDTGLTGDDNKKVKCVCKIDGFDANDANMAMDMIRRVTREVVLGKAQKHD